MIMVQFIKPFIYQQCEKHRHKNLETFSPKRHITTSWYSFFLLYLITGALERSMFSRGTQSKDSSLGTTLAEDLILRTTPAASSTL